MTKAVLRFLWLLVDALRDTDYGDQDPTVLSDAAAYLLCLPSLSDADAEMAYDLAKTAAERTPGQRDLYRVLALAEGRTGHADRAVALLLDISEGAGSIQTKASNWQRFKNWFLGAPA